jgi:glutamine cyclotransferase
MKRYIFPAVAIIFFACNNGGTTGNNSQPQPDSSKATTGIPASQNLRVNVVGIYPHDITSFTEGLQIFDGKLYEGSGDYQKSGIQISDIATGKILQKHTMGSAEIFGEGIDVFKGKIYQLTWQNHIVYVYNQDDITKPIKTLSWQYEGWGMTNDGTHLIISDGQPKGYLYFVDPDNFNIVKTITVQDNNGPINQLNELEYIDGYIYANVWMTDNILKIDPNTGNVLATINCAGLLQNNDPKDFNDPNFDHESNVLNGIAYDNTSKKIYITGKRWPKLFEVTFN